MSLGSSNHDVTGTCQKGNCGYMYNVLGEHGGNLFTAIEFV